MPFWRPLTRPRGLAADRLKLAHLIQFLFGISDERIGRQRVAGSLKDLYISCAQPFGPFVFLPPQVRLPPLRRGQNSHGLTVLGYRAPGNTDCLIAEEPGQILIAVWFHRVLGRDEASDLFPHALRSHIIPISLPKTALKKIFKKTLSESQRRFEALDLFLFL